MILFITSFHYAFYSFLLGTGSIICSLHHTEVTKKKKKMFSFATPLLFFFSESPRPLTIQFLCVSLLYLAAIGLSFASLFCFFPNSIALLTRTPHLKVYSVHDMNTTVCLNARHTLLEFASLSQTEASAAAYPTAFIFFFFFLVKKYAAYKRILPYCSESSI